MHVSASGNMKSPMAGLTQAQSAVVRGKPDRNTSALPALFPPLAESVILAKGRCPDHSGGLASHRATRISNGPDGGGFPCSISSFPCSTRDRASAFMSRDKRERVAEVERKGVVEKITSLC